MPNPRSSSQPTILWHDYETWGINPSLDFPVQFAAIRTDLDLNIIESHPSKINIMSAIPHDYLPHPQAALVTGITPQKAIAKGEIEPIFAKKVYEQMSHPNTCVAGYNSVKFDEEVTRNLFYRNLYPIYDREYKNGGSRWDIIDLVRACYALRPDGIIWPTAKTGKPSFKLEELSRANGLTHLAAHDALSDVVATIDLAKLIKQAQPKLYDYYWKARIKHNVSEHLSKYLNTILVYVSGYISADKGCCTLITPVCPHPTNKNSVICMDLQDSKSNISINDLPNIIDAMWSKPNKADCPLKLYSIAVNKCPFVSPLKTLNIQQADKFGIDIDACIANFNEIRTNSDISEICSGVYSNNDMKQTFDIDEQLYATGFPSPADTELMERVREADPEQLIALQGKFEARSINERLFRYRARHFTNWLDEQELQRWQHHLHANFLQGTVLGRLDLKAYFNEIESLQQSYVNNPEKLTILHNLFLYGQRIAQSM